MSFRLVLILIAVNLLLAGCKKSGFKINNSQGTGDFSVTSPEIQGAGNLPVNDTPVVLPSQNLNCQADPQAAACIYQMGPMNHYGGVLPIMPYLTSDLSFLQTFATEVVDVDASGYLKNSFIDVTLDGSQATRAMKKSDGSWKYLFKSSDEGKSFVQLHNYVYLTNVRRLIRQKAGQFTSFLSIIKVSAFVSNFQNNAQFDPTTDTITLGSSAAGAYPLGLDADVGVHEYGHAILNHATIGRDLEGDSTVSCTQGFCCPNRNGCLSAIHEGQADFHVAILSPQDPKVGQTFAYVLLNQTMGLRNPAADGNLTKDSVSLEIHEFGRLYASIWYDLYKTNAFSDEIVKLFVEHQKILVGADTFLTARDKILQVDEQLFAGKYRMAIQNLFSLRRF